MKPTKACIVAFLNFLFSVGVSSNKLYTSYFNIYNDHNDIMIMDIVHSGRFKSFNNFKCFFSIKH